MTRFTVVRHFSKPALFLALVLTLALSLTVVIGQARSAEPAGLLPNLVADPPTEEHLETSVTEGGLSKSDGEPRDLLRFTGYVHNAGPGALDIRGSREKPAETKATEEEVESHREKQEELPQNVEEELANPPMKVFQRVFTTSAEETNSERPHKEEPSSAEVVYVNADGHHHFHLQRVAKYSLWNAARTAEVAPAQKVGFCLEDSEHEEPGIGPKTQVYADAVPPYRDFCQQYRPNATSLFEGISAGWRDRYEAGLGFQWVEVSYVLPGEYWLREDVNPTGVVKETGGANVPAYAKEPTIIPGFIAQPQAVSVQTGESKTITVTSKAFERPGTSLGPAEYALVSQPQHGTLTGKPPDQVTYTPDPGYTGPDSFTFSAGAAGSEFPLNPAIATVSIEVGATTEPPPTEPPPTEPAATEPPPKLPRENCCSVILRLPTPWPRELPPATRKRFSSSRNPPARWKNCSSKQTARPTRASPASTWASLPKARASPERYSGRHARRANRRSARGSKPPAFQFPSSLEQNTGSSRYRLAPTNSTSTRPLARAGWSAEKRCREHC